MRRVRDHTIEQTPLTHSLTVSFITQLLNQTYHQISDKRQTMSNCCSNYLIKTSFYSKLGLSMEPWLDWKPTIHGSIRSDAGRVLGSAIVKNRSWAVGYKWMLVSKFLYFDNRTGRIMTKMQFFLFQFQMSLSYSSLCMFLFIF
jgi:hypothetical protein